MTTTTRQILPGESCGHEGCLSHASYPCKGCGRIMGVGWYPPRPADQLVAESIKLKTDIDRLAWYKGLSPREREIFISAARPIMEAIVNTWEEKIAPVIAMVGDGISKAVDMWAEAFLAAEDSDELPAEPGDDIRRDRHHGYNDDGILESEE